MTTEYGPTRRFQFHGQSIAYDTFGQGDPLVLIHGTPFSSYAWRRIGRELSRDYSVYVYDLLGYGGSEKRSGQNVSLGIQNEVLAALLDHWKLDKPKVIAHDFGAATALRAHLLNGCEYDKLLLLDAVAIRPWGSPLVQHVRSNEKAFAGMPEYMHRAILQAYLRGAICRPMADSDLEPHLAPWLGPEGQPAFYRQIAQMDLEYTDEVQDRYGEIRCPVHLLWGTEDQWIAVHHGRELATMIPNCVLTEIRGAGHLMQEDAPEAVVAAALRWFRPS